MIINHIGGSSTVITNGTLKEFLASGADVAPNTFVEFVGADLTWGAETAVSTTTGSGKYISAVQLDANTALLAYETGSSSSFTLCGHVVTFSSGTITVGATQTLATYNTSKPFCIIPMSATKAVLYCGYGAQTYAQHVVLTISGSTITPSGNGAESSIIIQYGVEGCKVTDTAYLIIWRNATLSSYWQIQGYAISGTTITAKQSTALGSAASNRTYAQRAAATQMTDGVAVVVGVGSSNYPTAMVVAADSSDAFTFGTATALGSTAASAFRVTRINDNLALALYGQGTADPVPIYAVPLSLS